MDPNATLAQLREGINALDKRVDRYVLDRAVEMFQALDEWLSKGGFLPDDWHEFHSACPGEED